MRTSLRSDTKKIYIQVFKKMKNPKSLYFWDTEWGLKGLGPRDRLSLGDRNIFVGLIKSTHLKGSEMRTVQNNLLAYQD